MGLISGLLSLPVSGPLRASLWVAGKVTEAAEAEFRDPATIRRALQDLERRLLAGEIDEDAFDAAEEELLARLEGTS